MPVIKVRERGTFWLRHLYLEENELTVVGLRNKIIKRYNDLSKGNVYAVYELWDRDHKAVDDIDSNVRKLSDGVELEVIFENPDSNDRGPFSVWYKEHKKM